MTGRIIGMVAGLAVVLGAASAAPGQTAELTSLEAQTTVSAGDETRIREALKKNFDQVATGNEDEVSAARGQLLDVATKADATAEFRTAAAKIVVEELDKRLGSATALKNRLALAVVVARLHNNQSVPVLLKLLGDKQYSAVRYWAAKGLGNKDLAAEIAQGRQGPNARDVLNSLRGALEKENDPSVVGVLLAAVQALRTEEATVVLAEMTAKEAVRLDLSKREGREAMKTAVDGLVEAFPQDFSQAAGGKQKIVAALAQILVRIPPSSEGLDLVAAINDDLTRMTGEKTGLADAVKEELAQTPLRDGKLADAVWLEQMNWAEVLLKISNKDLRLKERPAILEWTPGKSAELVAKSE